MGFASGLGSHTIGTIAIVLCDWSDARLVLVSPATQEEISPP